MSLVGTQRRPAASGAEDALLQGLAYSRSPIHANFFLSPLLISRLEVSGCGREVWVGFCPDFWVFPPFLCGSRFPSLQGEGGAGWTRNNSTFLQPGEQMATPEHVWTFFFQLLTFGRKSPSPARSPAVGLIRLNEGPRPLGGHQLILPLQGRVGGTGLMTGSWCGAS